MQPPAVSVRHSSISSFLLVSSSVLLPGFCIPLVPRYGSRTGHAGFRRMSISRLTKHGLIGRVFNTPAFLEKENKIAFCDIEVPISSCV